MLLMEIQKNGYTASLVKVFFAPDEDPRWIWCLLCRTAHTKSDGVQVSEVVATGHCERVLCTNTNNQSTSLSCSLSGCFVVEPICASRSGQAWTWAISTAERYLDRVIQGVCRSWHRLRRCRGTEACAETVDHRGALKRLSFAAVRKAQLIIRVTLWDTGMTAVRVRVQLCLLRLLLMRVPAWS
jgi:hypothetical protein